MQTDPKLEMARKIYAKFILDNVPGAGPDDVPRFDDNAHGVRIALAAIEECTERAAKLADATWGLATPQHVAHRLRNLGHLKGPTP